MWFFLRILFLIGVTVGMPMTTSTSTMAVPVRAGMPSMRFVNTGDRIHKISLFSRHTREMAECNQVKNIAGQRYESRDQHNHWVINMNTAPNYLIRCFESKPRNNSPYHNDASERSEHFSPMIPKRITVIVRFLPYPNWHHRYQETPNIRKHVRGIRFDGQRPSDDPTSNFHNHEYETNNDHKQ